jgi:hypothetical protein
MSDEVEIRELVTVDSSTWLERFGGDADPFGLDRLRVFSLRAYQAPARRASTSRCPSVTREECAR